MVLIENFTLFNWQVEKIKIFTSLDPSCTGLENSRLQLKKLPSSEVFLPITPVFELWKLYCPHFQARDVSCVTFIL